MRRIIQHMTSYAVVTSMLAVLIALGGTAWASSKARPKPKPKPKPVEFTSANVRNGSLTHLDIRNGSLESRQVPTAVRNALRVTGDPGPTGPKGQTGATGATGPAGDQGTPAKNAFAWAYNIQSTILVANSQNNSVPNDWYDKVGTGVWTNPDAGYGGILQELADGQNDGLLVLEHASDVIAVSHITSWHEDANVHSRLECRLRIANIATNAQANLGHPVIISSDRHRQVLDVGLVGATRRDPGTYTVFTQCRDLDLNTTGYAKWYVAKGNLSVLSARNWR